LSQNSSQIKIESKVSMFETCFLFHLFVYFLQSLFLCVLSTLKTFLDLLYNLIIALYISVRYIERFSCSFTHVMGYTHWLVGWLVGWSIGWLVGQSSGWLVNPLVGWSILWLVGQSSGLLRKARGQGGNGTPI
jgi:hypothetical protein